MMRTDDHVLSFSLTTMSGDTLYWNDGYSNVVNATSLNPDFLKKNLRQQRQRSPVRSDNTY